MPLGLLRLLGLVDVDVDVDGDVEGIADVVASELRLSPVVVVKADILYLALSFAFTAAEMVFFCSFINRF